MSDSILILGASSDLGCSFIERNYDKYDNIIAHYNSNRSRLDAMIEKSGNKIIPVRADLCDSESVHSFIEQIKALGIQPDNILHLAANKTHSVRFHQCSRQDFSSEMECSVISFAEITAAMIPYMAKKKRGRIVVMLTSCTCNEPPKFMSPYVVSKYALLGLVRSLAVEYAVKGINVNAVSPVMIDTQFNSDMPEMIIEMNREKCAAGRNLKVDEVLPTVEFLLSEGASMVNGQNILISGVKR